MIIVILAEPRSGSSNLALWFRNLGDIELLYEPISNPDMKWFKHGIPISEWKFNKEIVVIKETFNETNDFKELISIADKIIFLHRENYNEQLESFVVAYTTNNWDGIWEDKEIKKDQIDKIEPIFKKIKNNFLYFKEKYPNTLSLTYEKLYYENQIEQVINYTGLDILKKYIFPIKNKYRIKNKKLF